MIYAFAFALFILASFMWLAGQLHVAHRWQVLHDQVDELIYNLARAEQGAGQSEQEGG